MQIFIKDLTFKTIIGILPFERVQKQRVVINIVFRYEYNDKTKKFVDYALVAKTTKSFIKKNKFELIEEAVLQLKKHLYKRFDISNLQIEISKPDILKDCVVSIKKS